MIDEIKKLEAVEVTHSRGILFALAGEMIFLSITSAWIGIVIVMIGMDLHKKKDEVILEKKYKNSKGCLLFILKILILLKLTFFLLY